MSLALPSSLFSLSQIIKDFEIAGSLASPSLSRSFSTALCLTKMRNYLLHSHCRSRWCIPLTIQMFLATMLLGSSIISQLNDTLTMTMFYSVLSIEHLIMRDNKALRWAATAKCSLNMSLDYAQIAFVTVFCDDSCFCWFSGLSFPEQKLFAVPLRLAARSDPRIAHSTPPSSPIFGIFGISRLGSVLKSHPVLFFCYFWANTNRNRLPNMEIQKKQDQNRKNSQKPDHNWFEP